MATIYSGLGAVSVAGCPLCFCRYPSAEWWTSPPPPLVARQWAVRRRANRPPLPQQDAASLYACCLRAATPAERFRSFSHIPPRTLSLRNGLARLLHPRNRDAASLNIRLSLLKKIVEAGNKSVSVQETLAPLLCRSAVQPFIHAR